MQFGSDLLKLVKASSQLTIWKPGDASQVTGLFHHFPRYSCHHCACAGQNTKIRGGSRKCL